MTQGSYLATTQNYPILKQFVGEDVIYGPGDAPFGLDDKLGLTHLITLSRLLLSQRQDRSLAHPTIYLIARPDEEIGKEEILVPLVKLFKQEDIQFIYTVDGVNRFEVNATCFNAGSFRMSWNKQIQRHPYLS